MHLVLLFALFAHQTLAENDILNPKPKPECVLYKIRSSMGPRLDGLNESENLGYDALCNIADGKTFNEILLKAKLVNGSESDNVEKLLPEVRTVKIQIDGNVSFPARSLSKLMNVEAVTLSHFLEYRGEDTNKYRPNLKISPDELSGLRKLRTIQLFNVVLDSDVLSALRAVKDTVNTLDISNVSPGPDVLKEVLQFTNLTWLDLREACDGQIPELVFAKSASSLEFLSVKQCQTPKLKANQLKGLSNLKQLAWRWTNLTEIEPGSFDDLSNVWQMDLQDNQLKNLPDGLFNKNTKLIEVSLTGNQVNNLSKSNFTNSKNFHTLEI